MPPTTVAAAVSGKGPWGVLITARVLNGVCALILCLVALWVAQVAITALPQAQTPAVWMTVAVAVGIFVFGIIFLLAALGMGWKNPWRAALSSVFAVLLAGLAMDVAADQIIDARKVTTVPWGVQVTWWCLFAGGTVVVLGVLVFFNSWFWGQSLTRAHGAAPMSAGRGGRAVARFGALGAGVLALAELGWRISSAKMGDSAGDRESFAHMSAAVWTHWVFMGGMGLGLLGSVFFGRSRGALLLIAGLALGHLAGAAATILGVASHYSAGLSQIAGRDVVVRFRSSYGTYMTSGEMFAQYGVAVVMLVLVGWCAALLVRERREERQRSLLRHAGGALAWWVGITSCAVGLLLWRNAAMAAQATHYVGGRYVTAGDLRVMTGLAAGLVLMGGALLVGGSVLRRVAWMRWVLLGLSGVEAVMLLVALWGVAGSGFALAGSDGSAAMPEHMIFWMGILLGGDGLLGGILLGVAGEGVGGVPVAITGV